MATQYDPTTFGYQNFYSALLTADITSGSLTISLDTVPTPTSGILVIDPDSSTAREVILYTSKGASTVTCPSDGRGWAGSTAASHLTGTTVIMAPVGSFFSGLSDGTLVSDALRALFGNFIASGGVVAQSAGLTGTFSNIAFYLNGQRYSGTSIANKTYTASKDTYVDVTAASGGAVSVTYTEVANGAAAPSLTTNYLRVAKVVTSGAAITSVVQYGTDATNTIYPLLTAFGAIKSQTNAGTAGGTIYYCTLGPLKICFGTTGALTASGAAPASTSYTITLPTSFFNAIPFVHVGVGGTSTASNSQYASIVSNAAPSTTTINFYISSWSGSNATATANFLVIGF